MQVLEYVSENNRFSISIPKRIINKAIHICSSSKKETGGILVGYYSSNQKWAHIKDVTNPPKDSQKGFSTFFRGVCGLKELLDFEWKNNGHYYIGEWHYHPKSSPQPSQTDIEQMIFFSKDYGLKCPEPILLIIGGDKYLGWSHSLSVIVQNEVLSLNLENKD
jgi:integrative and conjugative element protein (TIGR02256 family)